MTTLLLCDTSPGEIRCGRVEDGKLLEYRVFRSGWHAAAIGMLFTVRIAGKAANGLAIADIGNGVEALLEHAPKCPEGTLLAAELIRMPIAEPGRWKPAVMRALAEVEPRKITGPHGGGTDAIAHFLRPLMVGVDHIVCRDALAVRRIADIIGDDKPFEIRPDAMDEADFDSLADLATRGEFPISAGMLSIERTRAMTMIDVDGGGNALALNLAAAREIPRLLRLLDIGGQIGIDFLSLPDRKARQEVDRALAQASRPLGAHERTAMNGFGFVQIVRPRPTPSIPEILCGVTSGRLSVETQALWLLREAARTHGAGARRLVARPAIIDWLRAAPDLLSALAIDLAYPIELVPDSAATGYGHVHVSQPAQDRQMPALRKA